MTHPEHASRLAGVVAEADRRRRGREADRRLALIVPVAAGLLLLTAGVGRFFGWSRWVAVAGVAAAAIAVLAFRWVASRTKASTDAMALRVDRDAALRGELHSAHWFEAQADRGADPWAAYHLQQATERAAAVDWPGLYPAVRAGRHWAGAGLMAVAALAISLYVPARASAPPVQDLLADPQVAAMMTPEMAKKLAQLMAQLQDAALSADAKQLSLEEFKDMMAKLDPALQKKLEEMLAKGIAKDNPPAADPKKDARPDRAENSAAGLPEDVRWAQEDMAARMAQQQGQDRETNANNPAASSETGEKGMGSQQAEQQAAAASESATPLVRESANDPGGKMMMGGGGPMGGDSRPGAGGNNGAEQGAAQALLIAQSLKKAEVEAAADALGENIDKEDLRKKTEQGKSTLGFTRVAPRTFDPSRASAPPPVPEARRQLLLNYFIRK